MKPATFGAGAEKIREEIPGWPFFPDSEAISWVAHSVCCDIDLEVANIPRSGKDAASQLQTLAAGAEKNRNELMPSPPCELKMPKRARKAIVLAKGNGLTVTVVQREDRDLREMMTLLTTVTCNSKAKDMSASH